MKKYMNNTAAGWAIFFIGYTILLIADRTSGVSFETFRAISLGLMAPATVLLYKGTRGKGGNAIRLLIVITQLWIGYALAALMFLIGGNG